MRASASSVARTRCGASYTTTVSSRASSARSRMSRAASFGGRNPPNEKASAENPDSDSAATTALGPGTTRTGRPASATRRTMRAPGSLMPGLPASTISAPIEPACNRATRSSARPRSLWAWAEISGTSIAKRVSRPPLCRVSSAAIQSTARSTASARGDRSPRLPIGVATT